MVSDDSRRCAMTSTGYAHIELNKDGKPIISGTRTKVVMIARERIAGADADEIHRRFPYLSLGQVHSALAYYFDHKAEMERYIEEQDRRTEELKASFGESPIVRTKAEGLISRASRSTWISTSAPR
jgi:uncharacterized protein (DUF433 family)